MRVFPKILINFAVELTMHITFHCNEYEKFSVNQRFGPR